MGGKILVALDDSENSMRAVEYVARNLSSDKEITLFSVLSDTAALCEMNSPELTPHFLSQQHIFCSLEAKKKDLLHEAQKKAKDILEKAGFGQDKITLKIETKDKGVARDIVSRAKSGYDTVVLGRRGISSIQEVLLGSISQKVLHLSKDFTLILVN